MDYILTSLNLMLYRGSMPQQQFVSKKLLCPAHTDSLRGYTSYWYDRLAGDRVNGDTAIFVWDSVHYYVVLLQRTIQTVPVQLFIVALKFIICSVSLPPHTVVTLADLQDFLSQLSAHLLLLGDLNARHHVWGSVDEGKRGQVMDTNI
jgi:hypothetical protein